MYTAIMLDIVGSKKYDIKTRSRIQNNILDNIFVLNQLFGEALEKPVYFSAGDEIQGLFKNAVSAYMYCRLFKMLMKPVVFRCGIGNGTWETRLRNEATTAQDGIAYQRARKAIQLAEESEVCNTVFISEGKNDYIVNSLLEAYYAIEKKQNLNQSRLALALEGLSPLSSNNILSDRLEFLLLDKIADVCAFKAEPQDTCLIKPFEIETETEEPERILMNTIPWGTSSQLVKYTGKSIQNISKTIESGNTELLRRTASAIVRVLYNLDKA